MAERKKRVHETVIREVIEKKPKKKTRKRKSHAGKSSSSTAKSVVDKKIHDALIENFISLQKVMVNLSVKFDGLSGQISKLLELFEISAKALAEKEFSTTPENKDNKEVIDKMSEIAEQNKIIARGLTLMHDRISEEGGIPYSRPSPPQELPPVPRMMPPTMPVPQRQKMLSPQQQNPMSQMQQSSMGKKRENSDDTYRRSISSTNNDLDDSVQYTA